VAIPWMVGRAGLEPATFASLIPQSIVRATS